MLNNVQLLRAIAAGFVVLAHLTDLNPALLSRPLGFGIFGVDLFFVISGFVMVHTTSAKPVTPLQFVTNRVIRIVPIYWALTLLVFGVAFVAPSLVKATSTDPVELIESLLFIPFRKSNGLIQPTLFVGWSLNYEMFFYAIFSLSLFISAVRVRVGVTCAVLALIAAGGWLLPSSGAIAEFYTAPIVLEFGFGMLIALLYPRLRDRPPSTALCVGMAAAGFASIIISSYFQATPARVLSIGLPAAAIVLAMLGLEARGHRVRSPVLLLLGAASYSLYLVHIFVVIALLHVIVPRGLGQGPLLLPLALIVIALVAAAGVAVHLLFERPVDRALRRGLRFASRPAVQSDAAALWPWRRGRVRSEG